MKQLFTDNRAAGILRILGTKSGMTVAIMAQQMGVSERTIRNDIKQLNEDLKGSAQIEGVQGKYISVSLTRLPTKTLTKKYATSRECSARCAGDRTMFSVSSCGQMPHS